MSTYQIDEPEEDDAPFYPWPTRLSDRKRRRGWVAIDLADVQARYERWHALLSLYVVLRKYLDKLNVEGR